MPELLHADSHVRHRLRPKNLIGRGVQCDLRLESHLVSLVHALITWDGTSWSVKDLASTNGTRVDGRAVGNRTTTLRDGAKLSFGSSEVWQVVGDAAPPAYATCETATAETTGGGRRVVESEGDRLLLPEGEHAEIAVFREASGQWCLESARAPGPRPVQDQDRVEAGGHTWVLHLPENRRTIEQDPQNWLPVRLVDVALHFTVRRGAEHVAIEARPLNTREARTTLNLGAYVAYYLLLYLARARLQDRAEGTADAEAGWRLQQEVLDELRLGPNELFGHSHRAKVYFARFGLTEVGALVERRRDSQELRIGVSAVSIDEEAPAAASRR